MPSFMSEQAFTKVFSIDFSSFNIFATILFKEHLIAVFHENTFRDINIAFANELAKLCRSDNMDVYEIIRIANKLTTKITTLKIIAPDKLLK